MRIIISNGQKDFLTEAKAKKEKKKKKVYNDEGKEVPSKCTKCGGDIGLKIMGEPVYVCKKCGKYYGTMPCTLGRKNKKTVKESKKRKIVSAQEQVGGKVNAGILDGITGGGMYEEKEKNSGSNVPTLTKEEYGKYFKSIGNYMDKNGLKVKPFPKVQLVDKPQKGVFIMTGHYEPENNLVVLYTNSRHPKDILRSFAHEMVHHAQNLRGEDMNFTNEDDVKTNEKLEKLESEAYLKGNIYFRKWTEFFKNGEENELLNEK